MTLPLHRPPKNALLFEYIDSKIFSISFPRARNNVREEGSVLISPKVSDNKTGQMFHGKPTAQSLHSLSLSLAAKTASTWFILGDGITALFPLVRDQALIMSHTS